MKKIVPDPPLATLIHTHYFQIDPSLDPHEALIHANEFLRELHRTLEPCEVHQGDGTELLVKAACNAGFAKSLIDYAVGQGVAR